MPEALIGPRFAAGWLRGFDIRQPRTADSLARLARFEHQLIWMRRTGLFAWGIVLYLDGGFRAFDAPTVAYLASLVYMEALHAHLRRSRDIALTTRIAAGGDSMLAFTMCFMHGGMNSVFIPHFYLTIFAASFRFGSRASIFILLLNLVLFLVLAEATWGRGQPVSHMPFVIQYMLVAFALGTILSSWAAASLKIALDQAQALESERDRSNLLLRRLINAQEEERKVLAEDLHDRMGESLFSIGHGIDACIGSELDPAIRQRLLDVRRRLIGCTSDVRSFMNELRPNVLDELGLCEALTEYVASLRQVVPFEIETNLDRSLSNWRSKQDAMLFRLIQEAILNARKHAHASKLVLSLQRIDGKVVLRIADDGIGCDLGTVPSGHFGLMTMRERAEVSGGRMTISSIPGRGTTIVVEFEE